MILEIRDSSGQLKSWHRMSTYPVTIGRSYANQVVIHDPFVCPEHLVVELDANNQTIVRNLSEVNGTLSLESNRRLEQQIVAPGLQLQIGRTTVVFRDQAETVQPALRRSSFFSGNILEGANIWHMLLAIAVGFGFAFSQLTLFYYYEDSPRVLLKTALMLLVFGAFALSPWVLPWSFASLIFVKRSHFCAHVITAVIGVFLWQVIATSLSYFTFAFDLAGASDLLAMVLLLIAFFAVVYLHLSCATKNRGRLNFAIAGIISLATFTVLFTYIQVDKAEFSEDLELSESHKPPGFRLVAGKPLHAFIADLGSLKAELEEKRSAGDWQ